MKDFQEHLVRVAHVPERNAPYYVGWIRQAYEHAQRSPDELLPPELEQEALTKLQQQCEDWQVRQARHALRLYR